MPMPTSRSRRGSGQAQESDAGDAGNWLSGQDWSAEEEAAIARLIDADAARRERRRQQQKARRARQREEGRLRRQERAEE